MIPLRDTISTRTVPFITRLLVVAELSHRVVEAPMLRRKRHFEPPPTTAVST